MSGLDTALIIGCTLIMLIVAAAIGSILVYYINEERRK